MCFFRKKVADEIPVKIPATLNLKRKALLIGINKIKGRADLELDGCVNDVNNMWRLLIEQYGFHPDNIRVLINERATKQGIIDRIKWLMTTSEADDELVVHYSGHGSQIRDRNGDELEDRLDEILCPYDLNWDDPLTDDIIRELFCLRVPGSHLTFTCDSCHSGTMSRNPRKYRFIKPPMDIQLRSASRNLKVRKIGFSRSGEVSEHVLFSGCKDNQSAADANINGQNQGAMTAALITTLMLSPILNWRDVVISVTSRLSMQGYEQIPQLSGPAEETSLRNVFGGSIKT